MCDFEWNLFSLLLDLIIVGKEEDKLLLIVQTFLAFCKKKGEQRVVGPVLNEEKSFSVFNVEFSDVWIENRTSFLK